MLRAGVHLGFVMCRYIYPQTYDMMIIHQCQGTGRWLEEQCVMDSLGEKDCGEYGYDGLCRLRTQLSTVLNYPIGDTNKMIF
jgi:hypothetical protein